MSGFVDMGDGCSETDVASEALVFMVVGLQGHWKAPVAYYLTSALSPETLKLLVVHALKELHAHGLRVMCMTMDGHASNISMCNLLGCSLRGNLREPLKTSFAHPVTGERVFVMMDACHMLKLARNMLQAYSPIMSTTGPINWKFVIDLNDVQMKDGLHAANKIMHKHVHFDNQKMKVSLAAQTLSHSVAVALRMLRDLGYSQFQDCEATAEFIEQHLTVSHTIPNKEELKLLMKYGNARTTAVLDCPVCDKPALVRLDKHLQDAHYINAEDTKRRAIIKELVALRLTCPTIRMVSCLDGNAPSDASSHSFNVPQPSSHRQTSSASVLATSSSLCNQTSSSSGLGHSCPLPSSPDPKQGDHESPASSREDSSHSDLLIQFQNLSSRLDRIESVLDRLVNAQASTSRTPSTPSTSGTPGKHATHRAQIGTAAGGIPCKLGLSAQKNEHVTKLEIPCNLFQRLVSDYQSHRLGPRTARKDLENARQAASHALRFCLYMGAGISLKVTSRDLRFLLQTHKLRT
ncbi:uncharacterized protein V6R79_002618 [Siganus canaliculatus]